MQFAASEWSVMMKKLIIAKIIGIIKLYYQNFYHSSS
jgi:hypothetical protein